METVTITRITAREAQRQLALRVPKCRVAELLGISRKTLWLWVKDGTLDRKAAAEDARREQGGGTA